MGRPFSEIGIDRSLPHIGVIMEKTDTSAYPRFELPPGFAFSHYRPGFERRWAALQREVESADSLEEAETVFKREFLDGKGMDWLHRSTESLDFVDIENSPCFNELTKTMLFVLGGDGELAGTGSLWNGGIFGEVRQRLHWIAVSPKHQGKGLSKAIVSKLLDLYNDLGYGGYIYLTSQTWSYKALNVYMKFGFAPYMGEKPMNWNAVNMESGNYEPWDYLEKNVEAWDMIFEKINQYRDRGVHAE